MKVTVKRGALSAALGRLKSAAGDPSTLEALKGVLIDAREESIILTTSNYRLWLQRTVAAEVTEPGLALVNHEVLAKLASTYKSKTVDLTLEPGRNLLRVVAGGSNTEIGLLPKEEFPVWPDVEGDFFEIRGESLRLLLQKASVAAATPANSPSTTILQTVHLYSEKERIFAQAANRVKLSHWSLECPVGSEESIILQGSTPWSGIIPAGTLKVSFAGTTLHMQNDDAKVAVRSLAGKYPDVTALVNYDPVEHVCKIERNDLQAALVRASFIARNENVGITLEVTENEMAVKLSCEGGVMHDTLSMEYEGDGFNLMVAPLPMLSLIKNCPPVAITLATTGSRARPIRITTGTEGGFYLIMPLLTIPEGEGDETDGTAKTQ